jgi:hypothetical protein
MVAFSSIFVAMMAAGSALALPTLEVLDERAANITEREEGSGLLNLYKRGNVNPGTGQSGGYYYSYCTSIPAKTLCLIIARINADALHQGRMEAGQSMPTLVGAAATASR